MKTASLNSSGSGAGTEVPKLGARLRDADGREVTLTRLVGSNVRLGERSGRCRFLNDRGPGPIKGHEFGF